MASCLRETLKRLINIFLSGLSWGCPIVEKLSVNVLRAELLTEKNEFEHVIFEFDFNYILKNEKLVAVRTKVRIPHQVFARQKALW